MPQKSFQTCHRPGQIAPMSFRAYESSRPWTRPGDGIKNDSSFSFFGYILTVRHETVAGSEGRNLN